MFYPILLLLAIIFVASCENYETYGDKKAKERSAIDKFIESEGIKVIDESTFKAQGNTTNVQNNEFVKLNRTGVYMQIVRQGCGSMLENGKQVNILCRFSETNILADSMLIANNMTLYYYDTTVGSYIDCSQFVDKMSVTRSGTTITASFVTGMMVRYYSNMGYSSAAYTVPSGWLVPLNYINVGRPESTDDEIAKVKLIVPHSQGTAMAQQSVYPCYYEITYEREK